MLKPAKNVASNAFELEKMRRHALSAYSDIHELFVASVLEKHWRDNQRFMKKGCAGRKWNNSCLLIH